MNIWEDRITTVYAVLAALKIKDGLYGRNRSTYYSSYEYLSGYKLGRGLEIIPDGVRRHLLEFIR